ncbi:MAG TPA: hypothetical protein VL978_18030 [Puia sp.]|nr:hypothetical protein [Puia sp.]
MKGPFTRLFAFGVILAAGCTQGNIVNKPLQIPYSPGTTTPVSTPLKAITSFIITAADNPGVLQADVDGNIVFDTIRLVFEPGTDISNLIPTIGIVGTSVSPASQTAQNFDSTVVYTVTAADGSAFIYRVVSSYQ